GSRADTGEVREAKYTVGGVSKNLVNTDNASDVVRFYDVVANAQGHIQIDTERASGDYSYLGVIEVIGRFASDPVGPSILVDFGSSAAGYTTGGYWNNLATSNTSGGTGLAGLAGMLDSTGNATKVNLAITDDFGGSSNVGEILDDAGFPTTAQRDSFFVQSTDPAQIVLEGLHPNAGYDLTFFGSRRTSDAPAGNLVLDVTINGEVLSLDARGNMDDVIMFKNILPDSSGTLTIDFSTAGFGYLGAMSVTMIVPEPTNAALLGMAILGFVGFRRSRKRRA
ncbi:MAG: PEP-CTERM sorting domain-containing protein, partial [Patescibacteria group bacterium]|nr:PEP-CTERM sorting domain-containing protein [Patescibacteria group bacterium]